MTNKSRAFLLSTTVHLGVALLLLVGGILGWQGGGSVVPSSKGADAPLMTAVSVSEAEVMAEAKKQKAARAAQQQQEQVLLKKKQAEIAELATEKKKLAREIAQIKQAQQQEQKKMAVLDEKFKAEQARLRELNAARAKEEKKMKAEAANKKQQDTQAMLEKQALINSELIKYQLLMKQKVSGNWVRSSNLEENLSCKLEIKLLTDGTVVAANVISSSGDQVFDRASEIAVQNASPLPVPSDPQLMKHFRHFTFEFKAKEVGQ